MKYIPLLIFSSALLLSACATKPNAGHTVESQYPDISESRQVVMTVHGLSCPLCAHNLDGVIGKIDGVESIAVDLNAGEVALGLAKGHSVSPRQLAQAVSDAGFSTKSIRVED